MGIINLWEKTVGVFEENGLKWENVYSIGTEDGFIPKEVFHQFAKKYNYDNGYGIEYVPVDLIIEGKGFRMIRGEYDGSEWWKYIKLDFIIGNKELKDIKVLSIDKSNEVFDNNYVGWQSLKELNTNNL